MIYNTAELDSMPEVDSHTKESTWIDTFKASTKNFTSVSLSSSRDDYYKSEMKTNSAEWSKSDPNNKELYERVSNYAYKDMEQLEALYDEGNIDAINTYRQVNPLNADVFLSEDFLRYKELSGQQGLKPISVIREDINTRAVKDFEESAKVIENSDSLSAELAGTMYGALHDVKTLQTLPLGTWKAGGTVAANAGRAIAEEMGIEALAQMSIAPEVYSFKKELGLKTSVATEAYNAAMAIGTAGLVRGAGSAVFDLSVKGIAKLKLKDPSLGQDYEVMAKTQPTQDMKTHIDNMQKVEFSGEPLVEIKTPNEKGVELNNAKPISEVDDILTPKPKQMIDIDMDEIKYSQKENIYFKEALTNGDQKAKDKIGISIQDTRGGLDIEGEYIRGYNLETQAIQTELTASSVKRIKEGRATKADLNKLDNDMDYLKEIYRREDELEAEMLFGDDMQIVIDKDIEGNLQTRSYKEINTELDENDIMFKRIQDCILGVK